MSNLVPFSHYVEVNPARYIPDGSNLTSKVSFVPMADVSESGHWFGNQVRRLNEVVSGFTNFKNNDVLVAKITPCFENGKGAFVADLENGVGFGSTEFHVLRAKQGTCARFIFHVTQWPQFRLSSERFMTGSAGQKRVQTLAFTQFEIGDFGEDEQKNIATILDTLDTQIRQTEAIIAKLQQVKQGLLHDLLTRGIDENGQLRPPREQAPELYKESPLGWIPKEWKLLNIFDVAKKVSDGVHYAVQRSEEGIPFLFVSCIRNGKIDWSKSAFTTEKTFVEISKNSQPHKGMILYTVVGSYGHVAYVDRDMDFGFERNVAYISSIEEIIDSKYLFYWMSSELVIRQVDKVVIGNAQKVLTLQELKRLWVYKPNQREQKDIVNRMDQQSIRIEEEICLFKKLKKQKAGLMDDLLTGRVRVIELIEQEKQAS